MSTEPSGRSCSRLFRVKDIEAFMEDTASLPDLEVGKMDVEGQEYCFVYTETGEWPDTRDTEDGDETIDFPTVISSHLDDGQVAVLESVSHASMDLSATSIAVNDRGDKIVVDLDTFSAAAIQEISDKDGDITNHRTPKWDPPFEPTAFIVDIQEAPDASDEDDEDASED